MNNGTKAFLEENIEKTVKVSKEDKGTLLALPFPYTTPCVSNTFQEMYYWDTYFTNAGLLLWGKTDQVKNNIENIFYMIGKYGFMPNGNRTYYLNRSQPPFLSEMVKDLYAVTKDKAWLKKAYGILKKEYAFWQSRRVTRTGLNGYTGYNVVEHVLDGNYSYFYRRTGRTAKFNPTREEKLKAYYGGVSVYESGWDCNSRVKDSGDQYDMVDLNSLLFGMEENMRFFSSEIGAGEETEWETRKKDRIQKMQRLWCDERDLFMDRNFLTDEFSSYAGAASFYPMYTKVADERQAEKTMALFDKLDLAHGISCGEDADTWHCQWDHPNVWAPIQFIVYKALKNYGYDKEARSVASKYVDLVESNFEKTGNFWEKYNGITGEKACVESCAAPMIGWTAGTYIFFNYELGLI